MSRRVLCFNDRVMAYQVFISFKHLGTDGKKTPDSELAHQVHQNLSAAGVRAFISTVDLESQGIAGYKSVIDDALDDATVLIVVGTSPDNLLSRWVRYEWDGFVNDILSGVKLDGRVFAYTQGVSINELPRALRQTQCFDHERDGMKALVQYVVNALAHVEVSSRRMEAQADASVTRQACRRAIEVVEAPSETPPFAVQAIAFEEDTSLVLSTDAELKETGEHPIRLMNSLYKDETHAPGVVLDRGGDPIRLFAVVHDLESDPTTRDAWIREALDGVLAYCAANGIVALGLDPLGSVHGRREVAAFRELLEASLENAPQDLERIWVRLSNV